MKKHKNLVNVLISALLIAATLIFFYFSFDMKELVKGLADADHYVLGIGCSAVIIYLICYGLFAKTVLKFFNIKISGFRSFLYGTTDFYYSTLTPSATGGQPMVIFHMAKDGVSASCSSFATFLHTAIFKLVLILFNILAIFFCLSEFRSASLAFDILWIAGMVINVLMILLCLFSMFKKGMTLRLASWMLRVIAKLHFLKNPEEKIAVFSDSLDEYGNFAKIAFKNGKLLLKLFIIAVVQRAAFFSIAYVVYRGMGLSGHGYLYFLCLQAVISMAVDSLPLPGGIGANEAALVFTLEAVYGTPDVAAAATLFIRLINYYFAMLVSTLGTFLLRIMQHRKDSKSESK